MPSPFPGMDPYLEKRSSWPDVHQRLITYISEALQLQIRPNYIARIGERIQLTRRGQNYIPDVTVVRSLRETASYQVTSVSGQTAVADEPQIFTSLSDKRRVPYIEIIYRETGDVVTLIEVLSPANKTGEGREQYLQKQEELLNTQANLVEIDLLSYGQHSTLARDEPIGSPPDWRYIVCTSRATNRLAVEVYAMGLKDRLPRCRIPLLAPDPDAVVDLTAVFNRCYDVGSYDLLIDYTQPPEAPLSKYEVEWVADRLQEKGLRRKAMP